MSEHAFLAPSAAGCTVHCAAAPTLQARYPEDKDSEASREGTAMHWAGAEELHGRPVAPGTVAPQGVILVPAMLEAVDVYVSDVQSYIAAHPTAPLHIETRVECPELHATANWGTPDAWTMLPGRDGNLRVPIWDAKFGHAIVEVFENWQLINYASGVMSVLKVMGYRDDQVYFDLRVVQPWAHHIDGPIRSWVVQGTQLRTHWNRLRNQYDMATQPDPPATPGPHCKTAYCTAARGCVALQQSAYRAVDISRKAQAHDMSAADLGVELRLMDDALKTLQARVDGLKGQALAMCARGENVPHWTVAQGKGREFIPEEKAEEFIIVGQSLGIDVAKPRQVITPAQARAKGMDAGVVEYYAQRNTGEKKLVPDTGATARKVFGA